MRTLIVAFQFLTIIPWSKREPVLPTTMARATGFFPVVGIALGAFLTLVAWAGIHLFPPSVTAAILLSVWIVLTGVLHLDGFLDACDGLFGGHTPEERLRIMRDECVGAFAVAGGAILLLTKFAVLGALLATLAPSPSANLCLVLRPLLLSPTLGRFAMTLAVVAFPYAREEGLGRWMKDHAGWREVATATAISVLAAASLIGPLGLLLVVGTVLTSWLLGWLSMRRVPGLTGDIYGALCEVVEVIVLLGMLSYTLVRAA